MKDLAPYYRILGLELGASLEEINQAYRDLAFIWHPDRIPSDNERLMEKAIARLQDINHARERMERSDVKYRFVIDMASLGAERKAA